MNTLTFILVLLLYLHITIALFSIYSHRSLSHNAVKYHPKLEIIFRFLLWMTNGVPNNFHTASHLQHHKFTDKPGDSYSVYVHGWWKRGVIVPVKLLLGVLFWLPHSKDAPEDFPKEWKVSYPVDYAVKYPRTGRFIFLLLNLAVFGLSGLLLWFVFNVLVRICIVTVPDLLFHVVGYRNFQVSNNSRNIPTYLVDALWAGEELHHNHHRYPGQINYAMRPGEFDLGYQYIKFLRWLGLATTK